jgi:DMSO/TMAO reductase YedYZ molybdopterin-dependent catalytic subunit
VHARLALLVVTLSGVCGGGLVAPPVAVAQATPDASAASTPAAVTTFELTGLVQNPGSVSIDDLRHYAPESVEVSYESTQGEGHETHTFTGVRLFEVLSAAGLAGGPDDADLAYARMYVVLSARDGYQVVLSMGEIAYGLGDAPILLAWEKDGGLLPAAESPLQLVVPEDSNDDRYIYAIETIDVRSVD